MAFRVLFVIAAFYDLDINQIDVKTVFLYGLIDQLIYVEMLKGTETDANKNMIYKLLKALYDLKQSPRLWYERLSLSFFKKLLGLQQIHADHSIFTMKAGINGPIISTFVNDIKIMGAKESGTIERIKRKLTAVSSMVDMRSISFYLGLKVERDHKRKFIKLSQPAYINKILQKFYLNQANSTNILMKEGIIFLPNNSAQASPSKQKKY